MGPRHFCFLQQPGTMCKLWFYPPPSFLMLSQDRQISIGLVLRWSSVMYSIEKINNKSVNGLRIQQRHTSHESFAVLCRKVLPWVLCWLITRKLTWSVLSGERICSTERHSKCSSCLWVWLAALLTIRIILALDRCLLLAAAELGKEGCAWHQRSPLTPASTAASSVPVLLEWSGSGRKKLKIHNVKCEKCLSSKLPLGTNHMCSCIQRLSSVLFHSLHWPPGQGALPWLSGWHA